MKIIWNMIRNIWLVNLILYENLIKYNMKYVISKSYEIWYENLTKYYIKHIIGES